LTAVSESEIQPQKPAGECLKWASLDDRKKAYQIKDCWRQLKQTKGIASHSRNKQVVPEKTSESEEQTHIEDSSSIEEGDYA
jgi:hypothetical protein